MSIDIRGHEVLLHHHTDELRKTDTGYKDTGQNTDELRKTDTGYKDTGQNTDELRKTGAG